MLLNVLRAFFLLIVVGVAMNYAAAQQGYEFMAVSISLGLALLLIGIDVLIPQKSLFGLSGLFFGLVVGMLIAFGASLVLDLLVAAFQPSLAGTPLLSTTKVLLGVVFCYLSISFVLQTKDDVRFVIPYVEFAKQKKGQRALILDTSVIIDGRIVDILETWITDNPVIVPRFVLQELQAVADSSDKLKRNRGRRGLDIVNKLQRMERIDVIVQEAPRVDDEPGIDVDQRLVSLAMEIGGRIVTNDYNLNKIAQIRGVEVVNVNDLSNAIKPVFLPGEEMRVKIVKAGEERGQGVGYLEDGTMVVVENARAGIGDTVGIVVTSMLQTSAGRMVFGRLEGTPAPDRSRRR